MNNVNVDILLNTVGAEKSVRELKENLKTLRSAALQVGEGSDAFDKITKKAGELNDKVKDINESIAIQSGNKIENFTRGFANLASVGSAAFQSILAGASLFGEKSESLEKTLVTLNAAMALTTGLKALGEAPDIISKSIAAMSGLITSVNAYIVAQGEKLTATIANTAATAAETVTTESATVATEAFTAAISLGLVAAIGAAVVGLTLLVDAINSYESPLTKLKNKLKENRDETLNYTAASNRANQSVAEQIVKLNQLVVVARDETKSRKDRKKAVEELNGLSSKYLQNLTLEGINTIAATKAIKDYTDALIKNAKAVAAADLLKQIQTKILDAEEIDKIGKTLFDSQQRLQLGIDKQTQQFQQDAGTIPKFIDTAAQYATQKEKLIKEITENTVDVGAGGKIKEQVDYLSRVTTELLNIRDQALKNEADLVEQNYQIQIKGLEGKTKEERDILTKAEIDKNNALAEIQKKQTEVDFERQKSDLRNQLKEVKGNSKDAIDLRQALNDRITQLDTTKQIALNKITSDTEETNNNIVKKSGENEINIRKEALKKLTQLETDARFQNEQNNINALEEGTAKQKAQAELNYKIKQNNLTVDYEAEKEVINNSLASNEDKFNQLIALQNKYTADSKNLELGLSEDLKDIGLQSLQNFADKFNAIAGIASNALSGIQGLFDQISQNRINTLNKETDTVVAGYDKQIAAAQAAGQSTEAIEKQKAAFMAQQEKKADELAKKQFQRNKAFQIANAIINTASAVVSALATPPGPPATIPFAVAAGVLGAVQVAAIAAQKYNGGTSVAGSGGGGGISASVPNVSSPTPTVPSQAALFGTGGEFNNLGGGNNGQGGAVKVFVLESDITATQQKIYDLKAEIG